MRSPVIRAASPALVCLILVACAAKSPEQQVAQPPECAELLAMEEAAGISFERARAAFRSARKVRSDASTAVAEESLSAQRERLMWAMEAERRGRGHLDEGRRLEDQALQREQQLNEAGVVCER